MNKPTSDFCVRRAYHGVKLRRNFIDMFCKYLSFCHVEWKPFLVTILLQFNEHMWEIAWRGYHVEIVMYLIDFLC